MKSKSRLLLIHPPVVRPTEPPVGISALLGFLASRGVTAKGWDANLEGILTILGRPAKASRSGRFAGTPPSLDGRQEGDDSPWTKQAFRAKDRHLADIGSGKAFLNFTSYFRAINDLKRVLSHSQIFYPGWNITLTNLENENYHPFQPSAWNWAIENHMENPFVSVLSGTLDNLLSSFNPTHVGFSLNYLSQALTTFAFSGYLKKRFPALILILGGSLVSSWLSNFPDSLRFFSTFSHVFKENGETRLLSILKGNDEMVEPGKNSRLIAGKETSDLSQDKHLLNYSPLYDDFPLERYLSPSPVLPLSFSRGCYWNKCLFCTEQGEGCRFLMLDPARGAEILLDLEKKHSPTLFHFGDNAIPPVFLRALIDNPPKTPWYGFIRFIREFLDPEFCLQLRKAGCIQLQLGLESGHPRVLEEMQKGITPEEAEISLANLKSAGIGTYVYLLFGTPFETEIEAEATLEFVAKNHENIDFVNLAIFSLPIQSPEAGDFKAKTFSEGNLHLYFDYPHPKGWNKTSIRRFLERRFKAHPLIRPIIKRKPLCFTSNHGPFFLMKNTLRARCR